MTPEAWDNYTKMLKQSSEAVWAVARYIHKNGVDVTVKATHIAQAWISTNST